MEHRVEWSTKPIGDLGEHVAFQSKVPQAAA